MPRVLVIVPFPLDDNGLAKRREQLLAVRMPEDYEFEFRPVRAGAALFDSHHDLLLGDVALAEVGMSAQHEGFDAICIDSMSDSGLAAMRSVLDIPVIGPGRAAFTTALMLGDCFSVITMWRPWALAYKKVLKEAGLSQHCVSVRWPEGLSPDVNELLSGKEEEVFPPLLEASERCVEDGAEVIVLGSTTMHEAHEYLAERLSVPVINPGPLSYKIAELMINLKLRHSPEVYHRPAVPKPEMYRAMLEAASAVTEG
jgi:Asp/Glu/hydantoin racemase